MGRVMHRLPEGGIRGYHAQRERAERRYDERSPHRHSTLRTLDQEGVLHTDDPQRITKRLARLGVDWTLAAAVEHTAPQTTSGSSFGTLLPPERFRSDLLGLERLMGRNDLMDIGFLEAGFRAARPVGRITVRGPTAQHGTGFLVSPRLVLTNHHVLGDPDQAELGTIEFDYQAGPDGRPLVPVPFALEPGTFFLTDPELDFTLVAAAETAATGDRLHSFGRLPLQEAQGKVVLGEFVNIIQHPNGEPKQLALRENRVVDLLESFVHYETDTAPGSSGSPVLNDQWEVVALHHAGVPAKDEQGHHLAVDGRRWSPRMGEQRLAWQANEGVRISSVLGAVLTAPLTGAAVDLRAQLFEAPDGPVPDGVALRTEPPPRPAVGERDGRGSVPPETLLEIDVEAAQSHEPRSGDTAPAGPPPSAPPAGGTAALMAEAEAALTDLEAGRILPYYDRTADRAARERYYSPLGRDPGTGPELRRALSRLLAATHLRRPAYQPMRLLYPWVDLHPDRQLRSIYSGKPVTPQQLIGADAAVHTARLGRWRRLLSREAVPDPATVVAELAALEAALPYNCEHVVPQSWFAYREPMRGDLHQLFACESGCNSFRGNLRYADHAGFPDPQEADRTACGRRESTGFEPAAGKGPVARAMLYFLLRYPGLVGDTPEEFPAARLETLLSWHENDPVDLYEFHRNAAIAEIQGNRNPFIDRPEWARAVDFTEVWPERQRAFTLR